MSKKLSRRNFLKIGGAAAVAGAATAVTRPEAKPAQAQEGVGSTTLPYPRTEVITAGDLSVDEVHNFNFPDDSSPCVMLKMGEPVPGGVGPDSDIVAYSSLCSHQGCPVQYEADTRRLKCPCHYTMYDPELGGQMIMGQATVPLPQILLEYNEDDDSITAVGIDGLIYGRQSNIL